jgi:predicted ArsR family transcriptional regulator
MYNLISKHPGLHIREIQRRVNNIPYSSMKYHLDYLVKRDLIVSKTYRRYQRYFVRDSMSHESKKIISVLREKTTNEIIIFLLVHVCSSRYELSKELGKDTATVTFHLKKLSELSLIEKAAVNDSGVVLRKLVYDRKPVGNEILYKLKNPRLIYDALIAYQNSLSEIDDIELILYYLNYMISDGVPKKLKNRKSSMNSVEEAFYDLFPHPYYG